jgi:hypothetical protein
MNPQVKEKWLSALRSGNYQQTQLHLHKEDGFCCLGVLCDLYGKENNVEWNLANSGINCEFQDMNVTLPLSVMEWAGVESPNPYIGSRSLTLGELNDSGSTFNEIADLVEEHL